MFANRQVWRTLSHFGDPAQWALQKIRVRGRNEWKKIRLPRATIYSANNCVPGPLKGWGGVTKTAGSVMLRAEVQEACMSVYGLV